MQPALYLIPVGISDAPPQEVLPAENLAIMSGLRHFIVENVRTARRFLRRCDHAFPIDECTFHELNGHTDLREVAGWLDPLRAGTAVGVMSEAGCPAVADPGALVVEIAQREGLRVCPLVGPSSVLLALMGSGFNGQGFSFHGYLPVAEGERLRALRRLEGDSERSGMTQIFIETPYRNNTFLKFLAEALRPDTMLCVAADLTAPGTQSIISRPAADWRRGGGWIPDYAKRPAIFLIYRKPAIQPRCNKTAGKGERR